jgi:hypothetical protein
MCPLCDLKAIRNALKKRGGFLRGKIRVEIRGQAYGRGIKVLLYID